MVFPEEIFAQKIYKPDNTEQYYFSCLKVYIYIEFYDFK